MPIQTFNLGQNKTITLVPAKTLVSNTIVWEQSRQDGSKYEVLLSFGEAGQGTTQWVTLFEGSSYKRNPTDSEVVARATVVLNL